MTHMLSVKGLITWNQNLESQTQQENCEIGRSSQPKHMATNKGEAIYRKGYIR